MHKLDMSGPTILLPIMESSCIRYTTLVSIFDLLPRINVGISSRGSSVLPYFLYEPELERVATIPHLTPIDVVCSVQTR